MIFKYRNEVHPKKKKKKMAASSDGSRERTGIKRGIKHEELDPKTQTVKLLSETRKQRRREAQQRQRAKNVGEQDLEFFGSDTAGARARLREVVSILRREFERITEVREATKKFESPGEYTWTELLEGVDDILDIVQATVPSGPQAWVMKLFEWLKKNLKDEETLIQVTSIFNEAISKAQITLSVEIVPDVYNRIYTQVIARLLEMGTALDKPELFAGMRRACFVLLLFMNRDVVVRNNVILDRRESPEEQLISAKTTIGVLRLIDASYKYMLTYYTRTLSNRKTEAYSDLIDVLIRNFVSADRGEAWRRRVATVTNNLLESASVMLLIARELISSILSPTSARPSQEAESLIRQYSSQLSSDARRTLTAIVDESKLRELTAQAEAADRLIAEVEGQKQDALEQAAKLRRELDETRVELEEERKRLWAAEATAEYFREMGPRLARSFILPQSRQDEDEFHAAWADITRGWSSAIGSALIITLLVLRSKYAQVAGDPLSQMIANLKQTKNNVNTDYITARLTALEQTIKERIDSRDWDTLENVWRRLADVANNQTVADLKPIIADVLTRQLQIEPVDFLALRDTVAQRLSSEKLNGFQEQWLKSFTPDGIDADKLIALMNTIISSIMGRNQRLSTARAEYERTRDQLGEVDKEINRLSSLAETLQGTRDALDDEHERLEERDASTSRQQAELRQRRDRFIEDFTTAVSRGADTSRLVEEGERLKREENAMSKRVRESANALSDLNGRIALAVNELSAAKRELERAVAERDLVIRAQRERAAVLDEVLRAFQVVSLDNDKETVPGSLEWFDRATAILKQTSNSIAASATTERDLRARIAQLEKDLETAAQSARDLRTARDQLVAEKAALQTNYDGVVGAIKRLYSTFVKADMEGVNVKDAIEALGRMLQRGQTSYATVGRLTEELKEKGVVIANLQRANSALVQEISELKSNLSRVQDDEQQASRARDDATTAQVELQELADTLNVRLKDLEERRQAEFEELTRLREDKAAAERTKDNILKEKSRTEADISALRDDNARLILMVKDQAAAIRQHETEMERLTAQKETAERRLAEARKRAESSGEQVDNLLASVERLQRRIKELEQVEAPLKDTSESLQVENERVKAELKVKERQLEDLQHRYDDIKGELKRLRDQEHEAVLSSEQDGYESTDLMMKLGQLQGALDEERDRAERAESDLARARDTIAALSRAITEAQTAREQLAASAHLQPAELDIITTQLNGDISVNNADRLLEYVEQVSDDVDETGTDVVRAVNEELLVRSMENVDNSRAAIVQSALRLNKRKKNSRLMEQEQRLFTPEMAVDEPVFTRLVAPRVEIDNVFTEQSTPQVTSLIEVDDAHEYFDNVMKEVTTNTGVPAHVVDQFYVFAKLVQGRTGTAGDFWLNKEQPGMRALVSHAIEATTKSTQTVFPVRSTKQLASIQAMVMNTYLSLLRDFPQQAGSSVLVSTFLPQITSRLNGQWTGATFSVSSTSGLSAIKFNGDISALARQMTEATLDVLDVQHPGTSVTRASHLAVAKYIKRLFKDKQAAEVASRKSALSSTSASQGAQLFSVLSSLVNPTFYAALQLALQTARIPLDFNDAKFAATLYDSNMAEHVAILYSQSFTRSRYTVSGVRTTIADAHVSATLQKLVKYKPPEINLRPVVSRPVVKKRQAKRGRESDEEEEEERVQRQRTATVSSEEDIEDWSAGIEL